MWFNTVGINVGILENNYRSKELINAHQYFRGEIFLKFSYQNFFAQNFTQNLL